jgi:hypothetical protein
MPLTKISFYEFPLSDPYQPGQEIGQVEADILNSLRADRIGRKLTKAIEHLQQAGGQQVLPLGDIQLLEEEARRLDVEYVLSWRSLVETPRLTVQGEARAIAREALGGNEPSPKVWVELVEKALPEAIKRLRLRLSVSKGALSELLE